VKVLFLTHRLPYAPNRGDRIRAYYLLREMSRFASVSLFSLVHDDEEEAQAAHVPFVSAVMTARVPHLGNRLRGLLHLGSSVPLTHTLLDAPHASLEVARFAAACDPDVVLAYCSSMARFTLDSALADIPAVLDMVDVDSGKWAALARETAGPLRWIYRREAEHLSDFEALAARHAKVTVVVNERERDLLAELAPDADVRVLPIGIEVDAFRPPGPPAASATVVFCGVMDYAPNVDGVRWFAREVWPLVRAARPDARFCIVGANPTRAVRQLAARDASIDVTGTVDAVQPYLWSAAAAVAPLRIARGVQTKVLEMLGAGLPVVTTRAVMDGLPREVAPSCLVAEQAGDFAARVVELLAASPEERRQRVALSSLDRLTWSARLAPLQGLLEQARGLPAGGNADERQ
jgi:sugar transferase (PEP-CTERM/EpsH1 system associated)